MRAKRKPAEPQRPAALERYPNAAWDGEFWRDGPYWYDQRAADKAVRFFADHLVFSEGEWAGQPFLLEPWEEHDIVRPLFGWKRADGTRRYRRVFVWVARKNGKTELAAGIALLALLGDAEPAGQVFSIASEKDQATIVFTKASNMVARSSTLADRLECLKESIYCPELNASFRPLSGKPKGKHGLNMSGLVGDEIHEWPNGDLYTFVHDSASARRQPIEFLISTAGQKGTHGEEVFKECQATLAGDIEDPGTLVVIYAPDQDDDWTKETTWRKANPNWGRSVKVDEFTAKFKLARQLPRLENDFKRYQLNIWTESAVRWLPIDSVNDEGRRFGWDHCIGPLPWKDPGKTPDESQFELRLVGKLCFGGLDLSATTDLSALAWWFPIQAGLDVPAVLVRFFKPADLVKDHSKRDRLPYDRFAKEGALITTPGNVVDYAFIQEQIRRDAERFKIAFTGETDRKPHEGGLAIDRWNATETAVKLEQEGIPVAFFGQGFASMSAPSKELERLVMGNGLHHGAHPLLRRQAQAVAVIGDAADNIKPVKDKKSLRIDGIVAMINALGIAGRNGGAVPPVVDLGAWLSTPAVAL
jgi:phage terminase large subunit-like protein